VKTSAQPRRPGGTPPRGGKKRSLRSALLLMIFAPLMSLLVVCGIAIYYEFQSQREETYASLLHTATTVSLAVDREIDRSKAILDTLAASDLIDEKNWRAFHRLASEAIRNEPDSFIALTEPSGLQPVRTMLPYGASPPVNPLNLGKAHAEVEWNGQPIPQSTQGLAQRVFDTGHMANSGLYYGISIRKPAVSIATPVMRGGRVAYVLIKGFSVRGLVKLLQDVEQDGARISIVDRNGLIIARNHRAEDAVGAKVTPSLLEAMHSKRHGVREGRNLEGEATVSAFRRAQLTDWAVNASIPRSLALARATQHVLLWCAIGIGFLAIGFIGARRFWRRVAPPLVLIGKSARAIQHGEYYAMPDSDIAEIDELATLLREAAAAEHREQAEATRRAVAEERERATAKLVAALRESEARFRALFEHSGTGIASVELSTGRFVLVNPRFSEITGYSEAELLELTFADITHPEDRASNIQGRTQLLHGEIEEFQTEKRYVRKDGSVRWVNLQVRLFPEASDTRQVSFSSVTDITARKEAELALQAADRRKDEFLATLAHELRNPLAPLRSGIEIWKLRHDDPQTLERVRPLMERQVTHMVRLIDDLLDVSRITTGRLELRREIVDLAEIVAAATEACHSLVEANDHRLEVVVEDPPVLVNGDSTRLIQVLENLLINAAKYTERNGSITVHACRRGDMATVTVRDTGIGIPADKLVTIFDMFSQVHGAPGNGQDRGLGIGLHIVKKLIELHGGSVVATSEGEGRGSRFRIELPLARTKVTPDVLKMTGHTATAPMRVLIVDDNRDAAESLAALLDLLGHRADTAFGGEEALDAVAAACPEVVLLDIGMPDMDGHEVARRIRARNLAVQPYIIAVTGWGQPADKDKTAAAGIDWHLVKPIASADVQRVLEAAAQAVLARRQAAHERPDMS
jgi:PAS domain S-box-containing protein